MPVLHKCFRIEAPVMGPNKPRQSDLFGPYNIISNAPVDMKINKSGEVNIKCTVLLLIPKDTNWSVFSRSFISKAILVLLSYAKWEVLFYSMIVSAL